jgi:hypothetical protein
VWALGPLNMHGLVKGCLEHVDLCYLSSKA